jgi:hypothetical protein
MKNVFKFAVLAIFAAGMTTQLQCYVRISSNKLQQGLAPVYIKDFTCGDTEWETQTMTDEQLEKFSQSVEGKNARMFILGELPLAERKTDPATGMKHYKTNIVAIAKKAGGPGGL